MYANVKQFILQPVNLLRKLFQNFKNDLSTKFLVYTSK